MIICPACINDEELDLTDSVVNAKDKFYQLCDNHTDRNCVEESVYADETLSQAYFNSAVEAKGAKKFDENLRTAGGFTQK